MAAIFYNVLLFYYFILVKIHIKKNGTLYAPHIVHIVLYLELPLLLPATVCFYSALMTLAISLEFQCGEGPCCAARLTIKGFDKERKVR